MMKELNVKSFFKILIEKVEKLALFQWILINLNM